VPRWLGERTLISEHPVHIHRRNKTARLKAALKAKRRKERLRKAGRLIKRRPGGRLVKKVRKT